MLGGVRVPAMARFLLTSSRIVATHGVVQPYSSSTNVKAGDASMKRAARPCGGVSSPVPSAFAASFMQRDQLTRARRRRKGVGEFIFFPKEYLFEDPALPLLEGTRLLERAVSCLASTLPLPSCTGAVRQCCSRF